MRVGFGRRTASRVVTPIVTVGSVFFPGSANNDDRRVKIFRGSSGQSANIGATDMQVECFLRVPTTGNDQGAITANATASWINGNIFIDADRNSLPRAWGLSLGAGRVAFGLVNGSNSARTIVGTTDIRDDAAAHVAITRSGSSGDMALYVRGTREALFTGGPTGSLAYLDEDDPLPGFDFSDPFLVLGAEKHDLAADYRGWISELRLSNVITYTGASITVPTAPLTGGASLYHFNQQQGSTVGDAIGNSPGELRTGATWSTWTPFAP